MMSRNYKIQRIELDYNGLPVHCPVCGQRVVTGGEVDEPEVDPCEHTLFVAHDEGFEYRSKKFDRLKDIEDIDSADIDVGNEGYDGYTDDLPLKNSLKLASFVGPPSFFGCYIGFVFED